MVFIVVIDHFFGTCYIVVQKPPEFHGNKNDLRPKSHLFFHAGKAVVSPWGREVKHHYDGPVADFVQQAEPLGTSDARNGEIVVYQQCWRTS